MVDQLVLPGHVVDVDLHDPDVRHRRAQVQGVQGREVAVVVVGRHVQLVALREIGDLAGLGEAVPRHVDHDDVHGAGLEVGAVAPEAVEVLPGADGHGAGLLHLPQRALVVHVDLHPHHADRRQRLADALRRLRLRVEVEVEGEADVGARGAAEGAEQGLDVLDHLARRVLVRRARAAAEAGEVHPRRVARVDDVGLEGAEAAPDDLLAEPEHVVHGPERGRADQRVAAGARGAAVRPVDELALPQRAAEQLVHRDAQRLGLDVPERELDARDGLGRDAARALPRHAVQVPVAQLDGPRVAADEDGLEVADGAHHAVGIAAVGALAVAGDAGVGADGHELPRTPAGVDDERVDLRDLHWTCLSGRRITRPCGARRPS
jgi:hypothetical protein